MLNKNQKVIGAVTVGQSPRTDLIPEILQFLGDDVRIIEAGALDGLTIDEVKKMHPGPQEYTLITRMADGTEVKIGKHYILSRMQDKITSLIRQGAEMVVLVCTGEFPTFESSKLLIEPQKVLINIVNSIASGLKLGVLIPDHDQIKQAKTRWSSVKATIFVEAASPYGPSEDKTNAARRLKEAGVQAAVLDCIGYTIRDKKTVQKILGTPVILARSTVARILHELL